MVRRGEALFRGQWLTHGDCLFAYIWFPPAFSNQVTGSQHEMNYIGVHAAFLHPNDCIHLARNKRKATASHGCYCYRTIPGVLGKTRAYARWIFTCDIINDHILVAKARDFSTSVFSAVAKIVVVRNGLGLSPGKCCTCLFFSLSPFNCSSLLHV